VAAVNLIGSYNYALVALSVLIAMFASYAALDLAGRVTAASGWTRVAWLLGGAGAMGTGIWSMHYIGMLAFILPLPVAYHWPTVLLSLFAVLISLAALWITFHFRHEKTGIGWEKLAGAAVMGAAIPVMHYTGMAAASFIPSAIPTDLSYALSISTLGTAGIAAATFTILGLALLTSLVDRRFAAQTMEAQEEKLQQSEAYLSEAQRLSHTGSFGWRASTGDIFWSEETFRIFQYDKMTKPTVELILQRVHPEDAAFVRQIIERAAQDGKDFDFEHRLLIPDGCVKYVHVVAHALNHVSGSVEFVGAVMDVTIAKQAEEKLRQSEAYLAEAQRMTRSGSWAWNVRTGAVFWSQETFRIYECDPERTIPSWSFILERVHPEDRSGVEQRAKRESTLKDMLDSEGDFRIVFPDARIKHLHSIAHPVMNEAGEIIEVVGTTMDITERKLAEEALRQAQADLAHVNRVTTMGELTASLAHEVNQPIAAAVTSANSCIRWLEADVPNLEKARAAAARIVKDGTRAAEIISRIRLLFQKGTAQAELVDVNDVIEEMIVLLHSELARYSISVQTELATDLSMVMGDRVQLQQVMMNLMMNSIDAMKSVDGTRELAVKSQQAENEQLLVSVSDTGVGLPPEREDQIFDAFFTTKAHGTGMGLRICRSIVESYGGRLWAANNPERGASFYVILHTKAEARG
jgi:signal transduction histidine kinase/NO-binding membrane sensor protein with MHYT domain